MLLVIYVSLVGSNRTRMLLGIPARSTDSTLTIPGHWFHSKQPTPSGQYTQIRLKPKPPETTTTRNQNHLKPQSQKSEVPSPPFISNKNQPSPPINQNKPAEAGNNHHRPAALQEYHSPAPRSELSQINQTRERLEPLPPCSTIK